MNGFFEALEEHLKLLSSYLATALEAVTAVIILMAILQAMVQLVVWMMRRHRSAHDEIRDIRLRLARWLVLSLEFLLAADIIQSAIAPTWDELGKVVVIVLIRTLLNYFLERDIEKAQRDLDASK